MVEGVLAVHDEGVSMMKNNEIAHPLKLGGFHCNKPVVGFGKSYFLSFVSGDNPEFNSRNGSLAEEILLR
jgi:hypothetical protein